MNRRSIVLAAALLVATGCHKEEASPRPAPIKPIPPARTDGRLPLTDSNMNPCALSYSYPIKKWVGKGKNRHRIETGRALVGITKSLRAEGIEVSDGSPDRGGIHLMRFNSIEDGIKACNFVLDRSGYANLAIPGAIRRWCGGKSQASYVRFVLDRTGIGRGRTIKSLNRNERNLLVAAMAHWEGGQCTTVARATQEALNVEVLRCQGPAKRSPLDGGLARR